jgi:Ca2+-binding EF-hand superfamily protein
VPLVCACLCVLCVFCGLSSEEERGEMVLKRVFDIFDKDGNGLVDQAELIAGLSVLCGGSAESKMRTAFQMFDTNGDGFIDMEEMEAYLTSVFKVIFETSPDMRDSVGVTPEEMAVAMTIQSFEDADVDGDGRLSVDEFYAWFQAGGLDSIGSPAPSPAPKPKATGGAGAGAGASPEDPASFLSVIARLLRFDNIPTDTVMETFDRFSDKDGNISLPVFHGVIQQLLRRSGASREVCTCSCVLLCAPARLCRCSCSFVPLYLLLCVCHC